MSQVKNKSEIKSEINQILEIQRECKLSIWTADDYKQELEKDYSLILVAKAKQKIIGFLASRLLLKRLPNRISDNSTATMYSEAEILNFGVVESHRMNGAGSLLFNKFLQNARRLSIEEIWLEVRASNRRAINFYSNRGFIEIQKRKNFYSLPMEDAIVMKLNTAVQNGLKRETKLDSVGDFEITSLRNPK